MTAACILVLELIGKLRNLLIRTFKPEINELISFPNHVLVWVKPRHGLIEVEFQTYS
jgi:hypothetical protein